MEKESIQAIRRIKKPLYKVIFSRFFLVIIFLIMQLFLLLWLFLKVHTYYSKYIVPYELCGLLMVGAGGISAGYGKHTLYLCKYEYEQFFFKASPQ